MARIRNSVTGAVMTVTDSTAELLGREWVDADAETKARSEAPDATWKAADLVAHALENGIDLNGASKKADVLAAITASTDADDSGDDN